MCKDEDCSVGTVSVEVTPTLELVSVCASEEGKVLVFKVAESVTVAIVFVVTTEDIKLDWECAKDDKMVDSDVCTVSVWDDGTLVASE